MSPILELLLEDFRKAYSEKGDKLITDSYKLDPGLYIKISKDGLIESMVAGKTRESTSQYEWFAERDFISKYINSNKSIPSNLYDDKKNKSINSKRISSNNYLTWFIKKKSIIDPKEKLSSPQILEITESYFNYFDSKNLNDESVINLLDKDFDKNSFEFCKKFILDNYSLINDLVLKKQDEFDNYVKVFFDLEYDTYVRESNRYLYHKVFNTDKYNIKSKNGIVGLSNFNMGLNSKKPYLEHKTMNIQVPYRVSLKDALLTYKYSHYLKSQGYGGRIQPFEFNFNMPLENEVHKNVDGYSYMNLSQNNGEVEIRDFDIIPNFGDHIECNLINHLKYTIKEGEIEKYRDYSQYSIDSTRGITQAISDLMFKKSLIDNFKTDSKDLGLNRFLSKSLINYMILSRDLLFDFYKKGIESNLDIFASKHGYKLAVHNLMKEGYRSGRDAFNLYYSIKNRKKGDNEMSSISEIKNSIKNKLSDEKIEDFHNDLEYSFAAGQLAYYLISMSAASKRSHDLIEPFLNRESVEEINRELSYWFKRYSHAINISNRRFNKLFSMILGYKKDQKKVNDMFLAGYLADNILYTKIGGETDEKK